eukprot:239688-Lingulodinium_polyedra.AAC.1
MSIRAVLREPDHNADRLLRAQAHEEGLAVEGLRRRRLKLGTLRHLADLVQVLRGRRFQHVQVSAGRRGRVRHLLLDRCGDVGL